MKTKHTKGAVVLLLEDGVMTNFTTNLSHDIEIQDGDIFAINWGHGETMYRVFDSRFPIVAEEIED